METHADVLVIGGGGAGLAAAAEAAAGGRSVILHHLGWAFISGRMAERHAGQRAEQAR